MGNAAIRFPAGIRWLTVSCVLLAALTATWGGIRQFHLGLMADAFVAVAFALVLIHVVFGGLRFPIPVWLWVAPMAVVLCLTVRWFDPVPAYELVLRMNPKIPPPMQPADLIKGTLWLIALVCVPVTIIGCTALWARVPEFVMGAYALGVSVSCGVAVTDLLGWTHIGRLPLNHGDPRRVVTLDGGDGGRQVGLTSHPNFLGLTCVIAIPLVMHFLWVLHGRWKLIPSAGLLLLFGGAFATGSRGAQVGALIVCALSVACAPRWRLAMRQALKVLGTAGLAVLVLGEIFASETLNEQFGKLFRFGGGSYDVSEGDRTRVYLLKQAAEDIANYPIGGIGIKQIINAHNIYIELLQAGGFILFLGFMAYLFFMYRSGWLLASRGYVAARYLMVSIGGWLILGMVTNQITDRLLYYTIGCLAAVASFQAINKVQSQNDDVGSRLLIGPETTKAPLTRQATQ